MELVKGRPETNEGRLEKEIRVYDLLDFLNRLPVAKTETSKKANAFNDGSLC